MSLRALVQRIGLVGPAVCERGVGGCVRSYCSPTVVSVPSRPGRHVTAGVVSVFAFSVPFITVGAYTAKMFASGLEDFDLFVPDDDDD